jgi:hypothetical protein
MLLMYGQCYQNAAAASRQYAERFPERYHPGPQQFINLVQRARDNGNLREHRGGHDERPRPQHMLDVEEDILQMVDEDPTISTRQISNQVNACTRKVWRTLHELSYIPTTFNVFKR